MFIREDRPSPAKGWSERWLSRGVEGGLRIFLTMNPATPILESKEMYWEKVVPAFDFLAKEGFI